MLEHIIKIRELLLSRGVSEVVKYLRVRGLGRAYYETRPGFDRGISFTIWGLPIHEWETVEDEVRRWKSRPSAAHVGHGVRLQHEAEYNAHLARAMARWDAMRPYPAPMQAVYHGAI